MAKLPYEKPAVVLEERLQTGTGPCNQTTTLGCTAPAS
jgi:hypothetical protein